MLNSISWSDFFIVVGVVVTAYYVITVLLLYSNEIKGFLKGKPKNSTSEEEHVDSTTDVLGTTKSMVKPPVRAQRISVPNDPEETNRKTTNESSDEELLTGAVSDLLDEIKTRIKTLEGWNKDEVLGVFRELLGKYPQLIGTVYQESINHFIANVCTEHFSWSLEPEEVQPLWPQS